MVCKHHPQRNVTDDCGFQVPQISFSSAGLLAVYTELAYLPGPTRVYTFQTVSHSVQRL